MWTYAHTQTSSASPDRLWARYGDPTSWPEWDHEITSVTVDGPMAVGTRGKLKPVGGPAAAFTFTEVTPGAGFTDVTRLPLARLTFHHQIQVEATGCRFTHRASISGPLSPLFGRLIGRKIAAGLPSAMQALARLAEQAGAEMEHPAR